jgi:hypothetical protein
VAYQSCRPPIARKGQGSFEGLRRCSACRSGGPPTKRVLASGVATSTHASAAVATASPLEVLTIALDLSPDAPMPDCPPNATSRIVRRDVISFVGRPLRKFYDLRGEVFRRLTEFANVRARLREIPDDTGEASGAF